MKSPIASAASLIVLLVAPAVLAQDPAPPAKESLRAGGLRRLFNRNPQPDAASVPAATKDLPPTAGSPAKADTKTIQATTTVTEPTAPDDLKASAFVKNTEPIEPWLLTKDAGPFMVLAKTFRGENAERLALALAKELRQEHGLPAYILRTKDFPGKSMIRNVPPTANPYVRQSQLAEPERVRSYDEAAVLVGNEKSLEASVQLLHKVRKINPRCLGEIDTFFKWRTGLSTATRTTNPFVPAQNLYPGRKEGDKLVTQMNGGPRSIYNCPGRYTIQVAEFGGRAVFNPSEKDAGMFDSSWLKKSPLMTAADDAEQLAERLARDPELQKTGFQPYVYHDRTSSKVMIGAFNNPKDPAAAALHDALLSKVATSIAVKKRDIINKKDLIIAAANYAPANYLTDLEDPNQPIRTTK